MFYTWACPGRPIGTSLGLDWDENSYLGNYLPMDVQWGISMERP